jgi:hypothetical protein
MSPYIKAMPILLLLACSLYGQGTAVDCSPNTTSTTFTAATTGASISNPDNGTPCVSWRVTYQSTGFSALSIRFETSPDNSSWTAVTNSICSATVQPPCVIDGSNPSTTTGNATFAVRAYGVFVRLNVTSVTGSGTITARVYGYKGLSANAGGGSGGGGSGTPGPPLVFSFNSGGAAVSQNGYSCRPIDQALTLTGGQIIAASGGVGSQPVPAADSVTIALYYSPTAAAWNAITSPSAMKGTGADPTLSSAAAAAVSVTNWSVTSLAQGSQVCAWLQGPGGIATSFTLTMYTNKT